MIFRELQTVPLPSAEIESFFRMLTEILISSLVVSLNIFLQSAAKFFTGFDALDALSLDTPSQKHVACCAASVRNGYGLLCLLVSCRQHTVGTFDVTFVDRPPSICILKGRDNENRHLAHAFRIHPRAHVRLRMFIENVHVRLRTNGFFWKSV